MVMFSHFSLRQVEHNSALHFPLEFLVLAIVTRKSYQSDTAVTLLPLEHTQKGLYTKQVCPYNRQQS